MKRNFLKKDKKYILSLLEKDMKQLEINIKEKKLKRSFLFCLNNIWKQEIVMKNFYYCKVESKNELFFD